MAATSSASPTLLARDLVTYPETVTLARTLATLPNPPRPTTNDALSFIAHRLVMRISNFPHRGSSPHLVHGV
ncbi:hypothetical protein, partial [Streptomyces xanthochromogenes]